MGAADVLMKHAGIVSSRVSFRNQMARAPLTPWNPLVSGGER